jgi:hypothetical protein
MSTADERTEILRMVETGQISAAEGLRLLAALNQPAAKPAPAPEPPAPDAPPTASPLPLRWVNVRVTNLTTQAPKVKVRLPLGLIRLGLNVGRRYAPELHDIDWDDLLDQVKRGANGKLVEVEDQADNERVEIFVE